MTTHLDYIASRKVSKGTIAHLQPIHRQAASAKVKFAYIESRPWWKNKTLIVHDDRVWSERCEVERCSWCEAIERDGWCEIVLTWQPYEGQRRICTERICRQNWIGQHADENETRYSPKWSLKTDLMWNYSCQRGWTTIDKNYDQYTESIDQIAHVLYRGRNGNEKKFLAKRTLTKSVILLTQTVRFLG